MKKLSEINASDFITVQNNINNLGDFDNAEDLAQAFVTVIYEYFRSSIVLLRLFSTVPYQALLTEDQHLVNRKREASGISHPFNEQTPVLTLLGTRGQNTDWNERYKSNGFRCIPLMSSQYIESLSMLSMQFRTMGIDFRIFDDWDTVNFNSEQFDYYSGILYVKDAGIDKDEQERMVVPRQDFVSENNIKTVTGFGAGYSGHPALVTLFLFTNEILIKPMLEPFAAILEVFKSMSEKLVKNGHFFRKS